jgi:hypothetical protein
VLNVHFPAPSRSQPERADDILEHGTHPTSYSGQVLVPTPQNTSSNFNLDRTLSLLLELLHNRNYTIVYTTTPPPSEDSSNSHLATQYEMLDYNQPLHTGLKRDVGATPLKTINNVTLVDGPLFARYQFFTPGEQSYLPPPLPSSLSLSLSLSLSFSLSFSRLDYVQEQQRLTTNHARPLHGSHREPAPPVDPLRRRLRRCQPAGQLCRLRQGERSGRSEEGAVSRD